jgi:cyclase
MSSEQIPADAVLPPPTVEEVSPGVFAYIQLDGSWCLNNPAFVVGANSVTAIDACATERRSRDFKAAIAKTSANPVGTLINTHAHLDHVFGNFVFRPEAAIVGHTRCREEIEAGRDGALRGAQGIFPSVDWGDIEVESPSITFDDELSLYVDDLEMQLIYVSPAHTMTDVVVWLPERKVLIAGDLIFNNGTPFALAGSIGGWLEALERLRALGAETIVPGHGPVCGPESIDAVKSYLEFIWDTAKAGFEADADPLDVARDTDLGAFAKWHDAERIVGNLHRAYSELRGEDRGTAIDVQTAFAGMIEYNGGQPLRCLA